MNVIIHVYEYEYEHELRINMTEIVILAVCFQLKQLKKQPEKKIEAWTRLKPMTLRYRCNALSTELSSHMDGWLIVSSSYTRW